MIEQVKERLASLGYEVVEMDDFALQFAVQKAEQYIKHFCNIIEIPDCLSHVWVDMAAGDFLQTKKSLGQLSSMQIEPIVKKIQEGDASVEYAATVDREATFNAYVDKMVHGHADELISHRKLRW